MFRLTRPGGYALINVAAMNVLRGDHSVLSREVRRYSRADLRSRLAGAGFTIERLTYTNVSLFLPLAACAGPCSARPRAKAEGETRAGDLGAAGAGQRTADRLLLRESVWLRCFNSRSAARWCAWLENRL